MTTWKYTNGDIVLAGGVPVRLEGVEVARQNLQLVLEWAAPYGAGLSEMFGTTPLSPAIFRSELESRIRNAVQALIQQQQAEPLDPDERIAFLDSVTVEQRGPTGVAFSVAARTEANPTAVFRAGLSGLLGPQGAGVPLPTAPNIDAQGRTLFTVDLSIALPGVGA